MSNSLSVRPRTLADTPLSRQVYQLDGSVIDLSSARRLVILIHGFNNSEADATRSFVQFRRLVSDRIRREELWDFHWPGDHPDRVISAATYSVRVALAPGVGAALARFILQRSVNQEVVLVAHSLGCRVALEAMLEAYLSQDHAPEPARVGNLFLLAAAVPVPLCNAVDGRFPRPDDGASEYVFHSNEDRVLRRLFAPGQSLVNRYEQGRAVGLSGGPGRTRWTDVINTNLDHNEYWGSREVADEILFRLGLQVERPLRAHGLPRHRLRSWTLPRVRRPIRVGNRRVI